MANSAVSCSCSWDSIDKPATSQWCSGSTLWVNQAKAPFPVLITEHLRPGPDIFQRLVENAGRASLGFMDLV